MVDSLDRKLIDLLVQDARQSSRVLAKQLNVNSSTISRRVKKLTDQGVVHIVAVPELERMGFSIEAVITLDVSHKSIETVLQVLSKHPRVRWVAATSGRFDVIAHVWLSSTVEFYSLIEEEVSRLEGVGSSGTFICLRVGKRL